MLIHKPTGLKFSSVLKPWPHQVEAVDYLGRQGFGALYTKPGSGKTRVFVDLIYNFGYKKILIVAPPEVCRNKVWETNFAKFSLDRQICVLNLSGVPDKKRPTVIRERLSQAKFAWALVVNYESVWRPNLKKILFKHGFLDCIILDESQYIKGPGSKVSKFFSAMGRRVEHRFLCTGTPGGKPEDIYAQYRFLDSSIFGTKLDEHKARYHNINIAATARAGYPVLNKTEPYINLDELNTKANSVAYFADVSISLPQSKHIKYWYDITEATETHLRALKSDKFIAIKEGDLSLEDARHLALRKQQLLSGYLHVIDDYGTKHVVQYDTKRYEALQNLLHKIWNDGPIVIFCQYRKDIEDVIGMVQAEFFDSGCELSGKCSDLEEWQQGLGHVLVVQPQSGSEGIDLTRACTAIYYTKNWSVLRYIQSMYRIHRPPQDRPVRYFHIMARQKSGTSVDEDILHAHRLGMSFMDYLLSGA